MDIPSRWARTKQAGKKHREPVIRVIGAVIGGVVGAVAPSVLADKPSLLLIGACTAGGVGLGAYIPAGSAGAGAFVRHSHRSLVEQVVALKDERDEAVRELAEAKTRAALEAAIDVEIVKVGATLLDERLQLWPGEPLWLVNFLVYNRGAGASFTASIVDQSVKGVDRVYPTGSFPLHWQLSMSDENLIAKDTDGRVDMAWVLPSVGVVLFLIPAGHGISF
jgi:hypothetical protein